jgi:1,4-alpha-glucan branching enzyme/maltooligosyltrehalose trehalohydrolase
MTQIKTDQRAQNKVTRAHKMPFGPLLKDNGRTEFRLWAPSAKCVKLLLFIDHAEIFHEMKAGEDGWHSVEVEAGVGVKYQFVIGDVRVTDPASKLQYVDVHGRSVVCDPTQFQWTDGDWKGRPWEQTVLYELNIGTFTPEGTFAGAQGKLGHLADLGVTGIELMPVADFPGEYGWGYDGVLDFAPDGAYGTPEDLKRLVQAAHHHGIQVFLDVVYNHFGPDGNYLHVYAEQFFTEAHHTAWGAALDFEGHAQVRAFFIDNALYWLDEFNLDGLRLDAVSAIKDDSTPHILVELAQRVRAAFANERPRHLMIENEANCASLLARVNGQPELYDAQWNDDIHHCYHVIATAEKDGWYVDYQKNQIADSTIGLLGRALAEGFVYQGEVSIDQKGANRGEKSGHLPPSCFVSYIQNHDQIGNRALGDRLTTLTSKEMLHAIVAVQLLSPNIPLLFMGEEWGSETPFYFFCNHGPDLSPMVTEGRRNEFSKFPEFASPEMQGKIPDPCSRETFVKSKLVWTDLTKPYHEEWFWFYKQLLALRSQYIAPIIASIQSGHVHQVDKGLVVEWKGHDDATVLVLLTNLTGEAGLFSDEISQNFVDNKNLKILFQNQMISNHDIKQKNLPPYSVLWMAAR